jgi:hypothetical protein
MKVELAPGAIVPPARWRHTTTAISKTQILVFGGFESSSVRLNDLWVYDHPTKTWLQPAQQQASAETLAERRRKVRPIRSSIPASRSVLGAKEDGALAERDMLADLGVSLDEATSADSSPQAPSPRGAHTAVLIGESVYIFGGYGG